MIKLGLDLGSSSAGWAIYEDGKITDYGVVTFDTGMSKGQSGGYVSPTRERREARSKRNLIKSRKYRKWELLRVLVNGGFVPLSETELQVWSKYNKGGVRKFPESENFLKWLACDFTYDNGEKYKNPYQLRVRSLDEKLSKHEFGRALYHLVQRRGYKDIGEADKETERQIKRRNEDGFKEALDKHGTIAKALSEEFLKKGIRARNQYPLREEYQHELEEICKAQGYTVEKEGKNCYKDDFVKSLWKAIIWQQPLKTQRGNIGKCILEPTKPRCPVSHPVFEIFRAWQFINTIKYYDENDNKQPLTFEMRRALFYEIFLKKDKSFKFEDIRKFLDKKFGRPKKYNYPIDGKTGKYDASVPGMPVCKGLIDIFKENAKQALGEIEQYHIGNAPKILDKYSIYDLWHIMFDFDEQHLEEFAIEKLNIQNETRRRNKKPVSISPLVELKREFLQGYSDLSLKALCKIIPFLKEGYLYNDAVVLARMPELTEGSWQEERVVITNALEKASQIYSSEKAVINIANNLIDKHKGLPNSEKFAHKDFSYVLRGDDIVEIKKSCEGYFGEKFWKDAENKEEIIKKVGQQYQDYFHDEKRAYRKSPTLTDIFKEVLKEHKIELNGELYHHSNRENRYNQNLKFNREKGGRDLPKDKKTGVEILPIPLIDSIKNPMFNKSMSIMRKLINELIKAGKIDEETEVVVEIARELNDNNKRVAIERYQRLRRDNRQKYRMFLEEFKKNENADLNIEESIPVFEMWTEQILGKVGDDNGKEINKSTAILNEKDAVKRYELWAEQKGQCMYSGRMISIARLFSNEIDIMHTIPRSILPDNTMANMTVGDARYNRDFQKQRFPTECNNFSEDVDGWGTAIEPRLEMWKQERDKWKSLYESRLKPERNEDETNKNKRIQDKHYFKMHFDYWKEKVERFEAEEVRESWARRQLVDTQMVSKYAREFLKLYFKKVAVQKGSVTADFRKLFGFQEEDEIKDRKKHTHHAIDAAVLTLIPVNSSYRERILKEYYEAIENNDNPALERLRTRVKPSPDFNPQALIREIEGKTLIVNYGKDKILNQAVKKVRKRGRIQYVKDRHGKYVLDKDGNRIIKYAKGDTIRSELYAQTYLGKIKDVERTKEGQPIRENGDWKYKTGKEEFVFVKREPIDKVKSDEDLIKKIVDPVIRELVRKQSKGEPKDYQGNVIRRVRVKTTKGREVKERVNYRSKHDYKNKFYSEAGSLPYAILLQRSVNGNVERGLVERDLLPIATSEVAKAYKKYGGFNLDAYINEHYPQFNEWGKDLLKVGQNVLVMTNDEEFEKRRNIDFQTKRLYRIEKFSEGCIWLEYHLDADPSSAEHRSKLEKDKFFRQLEKKYELSEIEEDTTIKDSGKRKKDFDKRKFSFKSIKDFRPSRLVNFLGEEEVKKILKKLKAEFAARPSKIGEGGQPSLLKMSKDNWEFLYEGKDFSLSMLGKLDFNN